MDSGLCSLLRPTCATACRKQFDIIVVSPRNYFLYTPLLPAVAVGTMEEHSVVEPVRNLVHDKVCWQGSNSSSTLPVCVVQAYLSAHKQYPTTVIVLDMPPG